MLMTADQVLQMAPDESSAGAGKKLMALSNWQDLGRDATALWGQCKGSALYRVKVEFAGMGYKCSCPSRKFPCKHVLGLLLVLSHQPGAVPEADQPEWVAQWLATRQENQAKREVRVEEKPPKPVDEKAQQKRAAQRHDRVRDGLERLDLWLKDLVRNGLAGLEAKGPSVWEEQGRRLVDAQAPGLAICLRRMGEIPASGHDWPERLLDEMGRMKLAIEAYGRIEQLERGLAFDLRQLIGWTIEKDELEKIGEPVQDEWVVLGQWIDDADRIRSQRTWCLGRNTKRMALVLQFSVTGQPFSQSIIPGSVQNGTMIFYPGAARQRAQFRNREEGISIMPGAISGCETVDEFLESVARALAQQPWLCAFGCVLNQVVISRHQDQWYAVDQVNQALPLLGQEHWRMLAQTGGHPCSLFGEWTGRQLRPLGFLHDGKYRVH